MKRAFLIAAVLLGGYAPAALAQVSANGFAVKHSVIVNAPPQQVYDALVGQVGRWWNPSHTYSGNAANLSIDARAGGCFCEQLRNGGSVEHMRIVYLSPRESVRMSGALGPLQASGLAGSLTWTFTASGSGTTIDLSYVVGGFMGGGFDKIAPAVQSVLGEQLKRLKEFVESR